jgi:hypothetical protein
MAISTNEGKPAIFSNLSIPVCMSLIRGGWHEIGEE